MSLTLVVTVEEKHPEMPAFVVVPAPAVAGWGLTTTTTVEGTLDGQPLGRRSLLRWDDDRWFIELPRALVAALGTSAGQRATLVIQVASAELPEELRQLLDADADARARWEGHSSAQQRMIREEILAAKTPAARGRRARKALEPAARTLAPRVPGLTTTPTSVLVRVTGRHLPGRTCGRYSEVCVGMVQRAGCGPEDPVPADHLEVTWETRIEISAADGCVVFRGGAVNGPPHERFLYLTWLGKLDSQPIAMFRRAKLRLDAVPGSALAAAVTSGVLAGELGLTDTFGMPVCGSVRPPGISWSG